jgi:very-short-patch-repair endonuclease
MNDWLHTRAKQMRHEPVMHERRLWAILRDRRLAGLKFRRQVVMGRYITDFVCFRHRLIVEADGPQHDDRVEDAERDAWFREQGFRVLRFPNAMIRERSHEVLAAIVAATEEGLTRD